MHFFITIYHITQYKDVAYSALFQSSIMCFAFRCLSWWINSLKRIMQIK